MSLSLILLPAKGHMTENMTTTTTKEVLENLFRNYDKNVSPPTDHEGPHKVDINIDILSVFDISEKSSSFTMRYYIQLGWYDSRLEFTPFVENNQTVHMIGLPTKFITEKGIHKTTSKFTDMCEIVMHKFKSASFPSLPEF